MTFDRLIEPLRKVIEALTARTDYHAFYSARVVSQASDGSVDIEPDDPRWPGMQSVPIRFGVPGVSAQVVPGAVVLFGFGGGNPADPYVLPWGPNTVTQLNLTASTQISITGGTVVLNNGTLPVARAGDTCTFALAAPSGGGAVTGTITVSGGNSTVLA